MTTTADRPSYLPVDQLTALLAAAGDPVAAHGFDRFRDFDPEAQLQLLQRMQQQFGSLKSWTDSELDMALEVLHEADRAEVERTHQARLHRLVAVLIRTGTPAWVDPTTLGIEPDGPPPGETFDYAVIHGRPVGQGLLPVDQVVYAPTPLDARPVRYPCPDVVFWIAGGAVVAHGTVTGHRTGNLVIGDTVAVASLDVDMTPWREPVDISMLMPAMLPLPFDLRLDLRASLQVPDHDLDDSAVDFHDGRPSHELPATVQHLQPAQAKALCQVLRTTLTIRAQDTHRWSVSTGPATGVAASPVKRIS